MSGFLAAARRLVRNHRLCPRCLGRMFAALSTGLTNEERGRIILEALCMEISMRVHRGLSVDPRLAGRLAAWYGMDKVRRIVGEAGIRVEEPEERGECEICRGIFRLVESYAEMAAREVKGYEHRTFTVGVIVPPEIERKEDEIRTRYGLEFGESIKGELSREIGKEVERIVGRIRYDAVDPELTVIVDMVRGHVEVTPRNVIVEGEAEVPHGVTIYAGPCRSCGGEGCGECSGTGRGPGPSLEYAVGTALLKELAASRWKFSARRLGGGAVAFRYVIKGARRRAGDADALREAVNREVAGLGVEVYRLAVTSKRDKAPLL